MSRDDRRLDDIRRSIGRIEEVVSGGREAVAASHILQAALVYNLQVIGEAASHISEESKARYPVPWRKIIGMLHVLVHEYFDVDIDLVWNTVTVDVPALRDQLS